MLVFINYKQRFRFCRCYILITTRIQK